MFSAFAILFQKIAQKQGLGEALIIWSHPSLFRWRSGNSREPELPLLNKMGIGRVTSAPHSAFQHLPHLLCRQMIGVTLGPWNFHQKEVENQPHRAAVTRTYPKGRMLTNTLRIQILFHKLG